MCWIWRWACGVTFLDRIISFRAVLGLPPHRTLCRVPTHALSFHKRESFYSGDNNCTFPLLKKMETTSRPATDTLCRVVTGIGSS